jgi:hypothetical protein
MSYNMTKILIEVLFHSISKIVIYLVLANLTKYDNKSDDKFRERSLSESDYMELIGRQWTQLNEQIF